MPRRPVLYPPESFPGIGHLPDLPVEIGKLPPGKGLKSDQGFPVEKGILYQVV
jgi:hypothetical protein